MEKKKTTPKEISQQKLAYLEFQADMGVTKHLGGSNATKELVELCHVDKDKYVLDVGCGIGTTACLLAKRYGCRAVGVDIYEKMIELSRKRAKEEGVEERVEFKVADAQKLPFEDSTFDVVICESMLAFLKDKRKALREMIRVTKPGGYIGFNETTWIKTPLPSELIKCFTPIAEKVELLTPTDWKELLESFRLRDTVVRTYKITALRDFIDRTKLVGLRRALRAWFRFILNPSYWSVIKFLRPPKNMYEYYGYGIYVGRK